MRFGYWNSTHYICCHKLDAIELALTRIFEQEGCRRVPLPVQAMSDQELQDHPYMILWDLWTVGLFVGNLGWTIIQTAPAEILCRRARGAVRSRLSELAMQTGCDAFHLGVYRTDYGILLEADAQGRIYITGNIDAERKDRFYEEQINKQRDRVSFSLLALPEEVIATTRLTISEAEKQRIAQLEARIEEEPWNWVEIEYTRQSENRLTSEALLQLLSGSPSYLQLRREPLVYLAYKKQQQIAAEGARLLYFQPSEYYQQLGPEEILSRY